MNPRIPTALAAAAAGALLGGGLVRWWSGDEAQPPQPDARSPREAADAREPAASAARERPAGAQPAPPGVPEAAVAAERESGALFSARLQAFARAELERGWRELRQDDVPADVIERGLQDYEQQLLTRAHWFGRYAAEQLAAEAEAGVAAAKKAALLAGDDGIALLAAIHGDEPEAKALVASNRFASLFARRGGGSAVDGTTVTGERGVADGATVSFPAGVFTMPDLTPREGSYPADVTVRGAGMDATLLVWDTQRSRSPVHRFGVEDCTVFVDNALVSSYQQDVVVSLVRVRFVGFDGGHGGSYGLTFRAGVVHAVGCRFEGGYGGGPSSYANVLHVQRTSLARFERCSFDRADIGSTGPNLLFVECALTEMLAPQPSGPTFRSCRYTEIEPERKWDGDYRRRDLNVLFPQWKERLQRR